jgi:hypothetical protein
MPRLTEEVDLALDDDEDPLPPCTCPPTCNTGGLTCKGECGCAYHDQLWQDWLSSRQASA